MCEWKEAKVQKMAVESSGVSYNVTTPRAVVNALEAARRNRDRVRLFYGDAKTGRNWMDEYDVTGRVSNSMGPVKIPILVAKENSTGGGGILDDCIVRMLVNGREVYRHPTFNMPELTIKLEDGLWWVKADGKRHASFSTKDKAERWVAFMKGDRLSK